LGHYVGTVIGDGTAIADGRNSVGESEGIGGEVDCHDIPVTVSAIVDDVGPADVDMTGIDGGLVHRGSVGYGSRSGVMGQLNLSNGILVDVVCEAGTARGDVVGSNRGDSLCCRECLCIG